MKRLSILLSCLLLIAARTAQAQTAPIELQQVIVNGSSVQPIPTGWTWIVPAGLGLGSPGDFIMNQPMLTALSQMIQAVKGIKNVRCTASGGRRDTTSRNDMTERFLAATDIMNKIRTVSTVLQGGLVGKVRNPLDGKTYLAFEVIYADGGSEKWMIQPGPLLSAPLFDDPLPNSLILGDGVVRPSPLCG